MKLTIWHLLLCIVGAAIWALAILGIIALARGLF
jgi:hypothetical protein